jgi:hypothetical protein
VGAIVHASRMRTKTFSPLSELLTEHVAPERLYLEAKWSSLISFELATELLKDTLPVAETINASSVRNHLHRVAQRMESALGDEQVSFVEGCPRDWAELPRPAAPLTVGIDGCYVREWEDKKKNFEIIVGKSMSEEAPDRRFGFVQTYDEKPKRRLFELLKEQGMQMNQQVKFFSDGGADIRDVQLYLNPEAEHYLDWFHVTMRITVMGQYAKGLKTTPEKREEGLKLLESTKHYLWHGNVVKAREKIEETLAAFWTMKQSEERTYQSSGKPWMSSTHISKPTKGSSPTTASTGGTRKRSRPGSWNRW